MSELVRGGPGGGSGGRPAAGADSGPGAAPPDFDALYAADPDPWDVGTSWYERRKIDVVLACLRREHYRSGWDAGCGTGHLTTALTARCDRLLATDASPEAVALSAARLAGHPGVNWEVSALPRPPRELPGGAGAPDLIVLSEVLYYLGDADREAVYDLVDRRAHDEADVVGVHWRPRDDGYLLPGAHAHRELGDGLAARGWTRVITHTDEEFLVGVWSRALPDTIGR